MALQAGDGAGGVRERTGVPGRAMSWDGELCWDGGARIMSVPGKHV